MPPTAGIREKYQALQNQYEALQDRRIPIERIDRCVSTKLIIRSTFNVCLNGKSLIYHKEGCRLTDFSAPFFLHVTPVYGTDLPGHRLPYGFDNVAVRAQSIQVGRNTCTLETRLPDYAIHSIRTGQYTPGKGNLWEETALVDQRPFRQD